MLPVDARLDPEAPLDRREEQHFERVDLVPRDAADVAVIAVAEVDVVPELGGDHHGDENEAVRVEIGQRGLRLLLEALDVDERDDEALRAALAVLVDAVDVVDDGDRRHAAAVEGRAEGGLVRVRFALRVEDALAEFCEVCAHWEWRNGRMRGERRWKIERIAKERKSGNMQKRKWVEIMGKLHLGEFTMSRNRLFSLISRRSRSI